MIESFSGFGVPDDSLGSDGDLYLDRLVLQIYQKQSGSWVNTGLIAQESVAWLATEERQREILDSLAALDQTTSTKLDSVIAAVDDVENRLGTANVNLTSLISNVDNVESELNTLNTSADSIETKLDTLNSTVTSESNETQTAISNLQTVTQNESDATQVLIGSVTETAPSTDTASSGLNGRLQRIAQRISSLLTATTDGTQQTKITDGSNIAAVKAASTQSATTDPALVVAVRPTTATLSNGSQTAVADSAVQILASNSSAKRRIIQNVGNADIRIGVSGVTSTTGLLLTSNGTLILEEPYLYTGAIYAIRSGAVSSTAFAQEITS